MYVVIVETQIDAEERAGRPAFLARLDLTAAGDVEAEHGLEVVSHENRRALAMLALPGQVFAACRWWRTADEDMGGEIWFTLDDNGEVHPLSREEALAGVRGGGAAGPDRGAEPRTLPSNIFCRPAILSGKPVLRGDL
jgi:hypothetical protein